MLSDERGNDMDSRDGRKVSEDATVEGLERGSEDSWADGSGFNCSSETAGEISDERDSDLMGNCEDCSTVVRASGKT